MITDPEIPPPWRDRGLWLGLPLLSAGLFFFVHQIRDGASSPVASVLVVIIGLGFPAVRWKQREKFVGWRLYYMVLQMVIGLTVIAVATYVSLTA